MLSFVTDPGNATDEQTLMYSGQMIRDYSNDGESRDVVMTEEMAESFLAQIHTADKVQVYDWGLWEITVDEVTTYYTQGKSIEDVAEALYSRYLVYAQENYG